MKKPYFEATRIGREEHTGREYEYRIMALWSDVSRIEEGSCDDFKNAEPKSVVFFFSQASMFLLVTHQELMRQWKDWLEAADNIQSVFRNN